MPACPFDAVPNDLLCEIFLLCLPSNRWETTPKPTEVPTVLTFVCKRWRSAALGFPLLWCWMRLPVLGCIWRDKGVVVQTMERFWNVLKRSQSAPLSLMVTSEHRFLRALAPSFLSNLLRSTTSSLTHLVLHQIPLSMMDSLPSGQFHALESLVYCKAIMMGGEPATIKPVVAFQDTPSLRRVALDTTFPFTPDGDAPSFILPWHQLTHFLDCDEHSNSNRLFTQRLITQSPNLRWLSLRLMWGEVALLSENGEWNLAPGPDFTVMDSVTTLALDFGDSVAYPSLFDKVDFPHVRTLRLEAVRGNLEDLGDYQVRFFARLQTFNKVELLSLAVNWIGGRELESLFESTPTAHTLHLSISGSYEEAFQLLEAKGDLIPHLHTLVLESHVHGIYGYMQSTIPAHPLQRLLKARTPGIHPTSHIRRIVVWGGMPFDVGDEREFVKVIQMFVDGGDMVFERHVGGKMEDMGKAIWMEMDSASHGWEETGVTQKLLSF